MPGKKLDIVGAGTAKWSIKTLIPLDEKVKVGYASGRFLCPI
jgi:hypothetical protein